MGRAAGLHGEALLCLERALIPLLFVLSPSQPWTRSEQSWEFFPCPAPAFLVLLLPGARFLSMPYSAAYISIYIYITYIYISIPHFKLLLFYLPTQFCSLWVGDPAVQKSPALFKTSPS